MNLKQGYKIVDSRKGGEVRKKSKIGDMAIRDMAVRGKDAIDRKQEGEFNEFYGNHPELNKLLDADSQLRKDAIDFFDTIDYLYESGYGDWVDKTLDGLLTEYPFGYNLGKRNLIFHLKNKHKDGTTRVFYFPDRGVINIEGNAYIEIGGDSDKKANVTFMGKYNDLEFDGSINHNGIDELVADVTASFFAQEEEEFGSSEIEDSVRVSDDAYDLSLNDLREPYTGASDGKVYYWVFVNGKPYDRVFDKDAAIWKAQQYEGTGYRVSVEEFVSNGKGADPERIGVVWTNDEWNKQLGSSEIEDDNDALAKWDDGVLAEQDDASYIPEGYNYFWVCNNNEPLKHFTDYNDAVQFALGYAGTPICIEAYMSNGIGKKPTRNGIVWTNAAWDKQRG